LIEVAKVIAVVPSELVTLWGSEVRVATGIATVALGTTNVGSAHPGAAISNANASSIAEALRSF
jgi:hypothetical protein